MNGYQRTTRFVAGETTDRPPFMPLVIDWAAKQEGVDYIDFVNDPKLRAEVYLKATQRFDIDCILPDADFYEQLKDFGMPLFLVNGRYNAEPILNDLEKDLSALPLPAMEAGSRMGNRLETLRLVAEKAKGEKYIFGICVGPFTEYCNARGVKNAFRDLKRDLDGAKKAIHFFHQNCKQFIKAQLENGADGIQIVEPNCSLISPKMYEELIQPLHEELVGLVHEKEGLTRLHVCGDTNVVIPLLLATGTDVLDVDHAVNMAEAAAKLGPRQALCGNVDPAGVLLQGTGEQIRDLVQKIGKDTHNRTIISGGCDVPEDTSAENMRAMFAACAALGEG